MDSPVTIPESPMDQEDLVYPCKGCGEILEEGKAFELAGNRWHIDCFRCNTCGTLLDSDANLLLLGDGSLICNNCTYSCNACGNKIEDLAILTGDQAFCASCFRCRNCKRKIENLRYARTSQGIFCMNCHETLMARRRKKAKASSKHSAEANGGTPRVEKALPSLPPGAASLSAFSPELETPPEIMSAMPATRSPRASRTLAKKDMPQYNMREISPITDEGRRDGQTLPASTYKDGRPSNVSSSDDGEERGFLPMAFDPNPVAPPQSARKPVPNDVSPSALSENRNPSQDYFNSTRLSAKPPPHRGALREDARPSSSRSGSTERETTRLANQPKQSPHIAYQEKGRQRKRDVSGPTTPASGSAVASPIVAHDRQERPKPQHANNSTFQSENNDAFKLQEVPKSRKSGSRPGSKVDEKSPVSPVDTRRMPDLEHSAKGSPVSLDSPNPFDDPRRRDGVPAAHAPPTSVPQRHADRPTRGDSLAARTDSVKRSPELHTPSITTAAPAEQGQLTHERKGSANSAAPDFVDAQSTLSRDNSRHKPVESPPPVRSSFDAPPPRSSSRPSHPSKSVTNDDFIAPRMAPVPPPAPPIEQRHRNHDSISTSFSNDVRSEGQLSPSLGSSALPRHSAEGAFSMEEELARIMQGEKGTKREMPREEASTSSVFRRVSNAVKHGRSFSDRGAGMRSPTNGSTDFGSPMSISSPIMASPAGKDADQLRAQLRRAQQRIGELEADKTSLEEKVNGSNEIKLVNVELREKRSTMAFLDTQKEMIVRELEIMTEHLANAKRSNQPLDINSLQSDIMRDFAESLQKLKESIHDQIEDLIHRRNELTDEISNLIQMKDKGFQEYESLSTKNAQLLEMNNQLVQGLQQMYKDNKVANGGVIDPSRSGSANGLGIYHPSARAETPQAEVRQLNLVNTDSSMPNLLQETEAEPATVLTAPQVVNIRKGQPKKFNWRKGGEKLAKNVTKGVKGAFASNDRGGSPYGEIGMPYNAIQATGGSEQSSLNSRQGLDGRMAPGMAHGMAPGAGGFGWLGQKNAGLKPGGYPPMKNGSGTNLSAPPQALDGSVLFGSELEARCDFEKRVIPSIVTRCVEEVEARGMSQEGVYRKSGGSGQVKTVQQGFEKADGGAHDISDPDLDIHAVTSALKQYFRKLPTPLITYDVYDALLDAGQLGDREKQAHALHTALADLPDAHRSCLEYLVMHLVRVVAHQDENLMTPLNLAVVFAPTIMRPLSIEREMSDMQAQRAAVQALLDCHAAVFSGDE